MVRTELKQNYLSFYISIPTSFHGPPPENKSNSQASTKLWEGHSWQGLSLVVENGGYSLVGVHGLLIAVAFLFVEHRSPDSQVARGLSSCSIVVVPGLSCL